MAAKVISLQRRIDELERVAFEKARLEERMTMFYEAKEIIDILPNDLVLRLMTVCRERLGKG